MILEERMQDPWWGRGPSMLPVMGRAGSARLCACYVPHTGHIVSSFLMLNFSVEKPLPLGSPSWPWLEWMPLLCGLIRWSPTQLLICLVPPPGQSPLCSSCLLLWPEGFFFVIEGIGAVDPSQAEEGPISFQLPHEFPAGSLLAFWNWEHPGERQGHGSCKDKAGCLASPWPFISSAHALCRCGPH